MTRDGPRNVRLSAAQIRAVLWAVGQHTDANARDIGEMMKEGLERRECLSLLSAQSKLEQALRVVRS